MRRPSHTCPATPTLPKCRVRLPDRRTIKLAEPQWRSRTCPVATAALPKHRPAPCPYPTHAGFAGPVTKQLARPSQVGRGQPRRCCGWRATGPGRRSRSAGGPARNGSWPICRTIQPSASMLCRRCRLWPLKAARIAVGWSSRSWIAACRSGYPARSVPQHAALRKICLPTAVSAIPRVMPRDSPGSIAILRKTVVACRTGGSLRSARYPLILRKALTPNTRMSCTGPLPH